MRYLSATLLLVFALLCAGVQRVVSFAPCAAGSTAIGARCPAECGNAYDQCGPASFSGPKCCKPGLVCSVVNPNYSQCKPENPPKPTTCAKPFNQCGGTGYSGPKCCTTGYVCDQQIIENQFYSQCVASPESGCPCAGNAGYCKKSGGTRTCTACAGVVTEDETLECCPRGAAGYNPNQGATAGNGPMWELPVSLNAAGRTYKVCNWKRLTPNGKWSSSVEACPSNDPTVLRDQHNTQLKTAPYVGFRFCPNANGYLHASTVGLDAGKDPLVAIERESDNKCLIFDDDEGGLSSLVGVAVVKGQCYVVHLTTYSGTDLPSGIKIWFDQVAPPPAASNPSSRSQNAIPPEKKVV